MPDRRQSARLPAIEARIVKVRGAAVLLDAHLADLYGIPTKALL
jgi:hypothetical protein